jgi:hypothetical protein
MLEKLTTHDIQDVFALLSLADKCAKAAEGHTLQPSRQKEEGWRQPTASRSTMGGGRGGPRGDKRPCQLSNSDDGSTKCPIHNSMRHSASKCQEIKKLVE